jgi:hypothetical protein
VVQARIFPPKIRFRLSDSCVICGAGLIGRERSYCRECRCQLDELRWAFLDVKIGLPR